MNIHNNINPYQVTEDFKNYYKNFFKEKGFEIIDVPKDEFHYDLTLKRLKDNKEYRCEIKSMPSENEKGIFGCATFTDFTIDSILQEKIDLLFFYEATRNKDDEINRFIPTGKNFFFTKNGYIKTFFKKIKDSGKYHNFISNRDSKGRMLVSIVNELTKDQVQEYYRKSLQVCPNDLKHCIKKITKTKLKNCFTINELVEKLNLGDAYYTENNKRIYY